MIRNAFLTGHVALGCANAMSAVVQTLVKMWAAIKWVRAKKTSGPYRRAPEPVPLELPPAVAAAREELRRQGAPEPAAGSGAASSFEPASSSGGPGSSHNGGVPGTPGPSHSCGAPGTPMPGTPSVRRIEVVTEAGEERFRVRDSGPWVPNPDQTGVGKAG